MKRYLIFIIFNLFVSYLNAQNKDVVYEDLKKNQIGIINISIFSIIPQYTYNSISYPKNIGLFYQRNMNKNYARIEASHAYNIDYLFVYYMFNLGVGKNIRISKDLYLNGGLKFDCLSVYRHDYNYSRKNSLYVSDIFGTGLEIGAHYYVGSLIFGTELSYSYGININRTENYKSFDNFSSEFISIKIGRVF